MTTSDDWTVSHFSQSNPKGPRQEDVPALLRRVADSIETLGEIDIQDIVCNCPGELTDDGWWPSITVYYSRKDAQS